MARGRPVSFDKGDTLEKTLRVFWQGGYLGTSYTDLCAVTGLTKPSLYGAYGNKEETFIAALNMYLERFVRPGVDMFEQEPNPRVGIHRLLIATVEGLTAEGMPMGCMIAANIAGAGAKDVPEVVSAALRNATKETPNAIFRRLSEAAPQELPPGSCPASLTRYFEAVIAGLSGLARQGASRDELLAIVETAMLCWQAPPPGLMFSWADFR